MSKFKSGDWIGAFLLTTLSIFALWDLIAWLLGYSTMSQRVIIYSSNSLLFTILSILFCFLIASVGVMLILHWELNEILHKHISRVSSGKVRLQENKKMVKKILNWALGLSWLGKVGKALNGKKTIIGALALLIHVLQVAPQVFPECSVCPDIANGLQSALEYIGVSLVSIGLAHKAVK